jgi:hypothetical protein
MKQNLSVRASNVLHCLKAKFPSKAICSLDVSSLRLAIKCPTLPES